MHSLAASNAVEFCGGEVEQGVPLCRVEVLHPRVVLGVHLRQREPVAAIVRFTHAIDGPVRCEHAPET
eukprot:12569416-Prorocentrum_lima.AAC.1